jgi:hypothetical protein
MRRVAPALAIAIASAWLAACSLALSFDGIDDGTRDGGQDAPGADSVLAADGPKADQTVDAPASDAMPDASAGDTTVGPDVGTPSDSGASSEASPVDTGTDVVEAAPPDAGCGATAFPAMVDVGGFCIDSTEVTVDQYIAFLSAKAGDTSGQPPGCTSNNSYTPGRNWPPSGPTNQAIVGIDWCDAYMYCAWANKRLCGAIGGGSVDPSQSSNAAVSQWFKACSHADDGLHVYPYGLNYDPSACNGADYDAHAPLPSVATCQGGYPGVFDMSGNVIEWEDSCQVDPDAGPGPSDCCLIRGGGFNQNAVQLQCGNWLCTGRLNGGGDNGFRCCSK